MSTPEKPIQAKLVIGLFTKDKSILPKLTEQIAGAYGAIDIVSPWFSFDYTSYYEPEMGGPLFRRMLAFENLICQEDLPDIKLATNRIEGNFSKENRRRVNIDPGYMTPERFVLATGKNFTHRIYIGKGIYADLTLIFTKNRFQTLDWTYPDYADHEMRSFLVLVRNRYMIKLKGCEKR